MQCNSHSLLDQDSDALHSTTSGSLFHAFHPEVVVFVGKNLKFAIGLLIYDLGSLFTIPLKVNGRFGAAAALTLTPFLSFMMNLTMDLEVSGIPLLDHRTFYPGVIHHPLFLDSQIHG